ncbi:Leucine-rich repeat and guanylate kinase domain-containing protein [Habropoda laboriosa]|uniref:Leucine-rich repeat and guanylate kinase domain-containing protein n=1 Tax=Habropoda laboriosa TaxID=597456 RepID=A0A0L7QUH0_9HYME|nr:Leucine-rich repeat and guanylate kinase domain-containing protein [Habropoda laboriosa]
MSWGSLEDRYVPFEIQSEEDSSSITSTSSTSSSNLSFSLLDQVPLSIDHDILECATSSSWSSYALDINLWNDDRAPVVKLRHLKEMLFDDLEFWGLFTDRLIGVGKSFLTKSPENGLYILSKCIMRNMSLSNISLLKHHRYLQYIDLAYNYISNLSPLEGIPYLIYLNVSHNRLETILNFSPPWYLTYVNLSYNYISNMCDISDFWSIVHLDLSHNAIENISGLQSLKYLKYLNLSYNLIEHIENLDKLNIQELNLEGNCILFDAYSLRVIDLKFNRINDLLELSNIKGLIHEIDLRGNGCTKWPNYKSVLLFSMPSICIIDGIDVSTSEKIAAVTLFASPVNLTAARTITKLTLLEQLSTPKIDLHVRPYDETSPPLIVLTGPSAVKKLSLALQIAQTLPKKVKYCQWYTTKESEPNETDFEPYIFVNREEFNDMSRHGEFLAIQERLGNSYGFHHNQITSLILENKIGITQADLHAAIQIIKRYSNSKAVLVLTKSEQIHRERVQEKFYVYTYTKNSKKYVTESELNFIKEILNDIIENVQTSSIDVLGKQHDNATIDIALENKTLFDIKTDKNYLQVILDEHANIIIEDEHLKRKRHQEKLLQRRDTLVRGADFPLIEELSESVSSEEILTKKVEAKQPEHMKDFYTEVIIKSRKIYLDQHMNKPGFFSLVVLTDNYFKAFNKLINFIYELYINYPLEKPKFSSELNHFSDVAVPTMVNSVVDEMIQSLSTSILQRKTLLRMYGVTSWKELVPNQRIENSINIAD